MDVRSVYPRRLPSFLLSVACAGVCLLAPATAADSQISNQSRPQRDTLIQTFLTIDHALEALGQSSSDYRKVLSNALAAMPTGADDIRSKIVTFLTRAPQSGPDFRCSRDFLRSRARTMMLGLRDTLLELGAVRTEPVVCYATPFAVDAGLPQATTGSVEVYGFDFDVSAPQLVLVTETGPVDVTSAVVPRSHTHLTIDLARVPLSSTSVSLELAWGHVIRHSIAIIQADTRLCSSQVERIPAGRTISDTLPRIGSEGALKNRASRIRTDAWLDYANNKLEATVCTTADQAGSSPVFSRCLVEFLYTTHPDRIIEGIVGDQPAKDPVRRWSVSGPAQSGPDNVMSFTARLNEIRIVSTDSNRCISPIAYLEAARTTGLSPATKRRLNSQLRSVDASIKAIRPRFAPPLN